MRDFARKTLIVIALLQFAAPLLPLAGFGETMGVRAVEGGIPPELPLGLFFSIWSVIFLGYLWLAIAALRAPDTVSAVILAPLWLAGLGNVVWMVSAQLIGLAWLDFLLLVPILLMAWEAAQRLELTGGGGRSVNGHISELVTGLLAGWLAVAVSISVPDVVRTVFGYGASDYVWPSLWLALVPAAGLAWLFASRFSQSWWFFAALAWGLIGVFANNWFRTQTHALALAVFVFGLYVLWRRARYGAQGANQPMS